MDNTKLITVYKLVRKMKDGTIAPLFINKKFRFPIGEWLESESHPTKGFAYRPGWHCTLKMEAPHLSEKDRVWVKGLAENYELYDRPESQGGTWVLSQRFKVLEVLD